MKTFKQFASEAGIVRSVDGMKNLSNDEVNQSLKIIDKSSGSKSQFKKRMGVFLKQIGI